MEIEQSPQEILAKKVYNSIRTIIYMMRKGISKCKVMVFNLHIAIKAIGNLRQLHHHYSAFTCQSDDVLTSFISPREYEFSCSNSPTTPLYRCRRRRRRRHSRSHCHNRMEPLPLMAVTLPGFGRSPLVRQLRVTDSPFSLQDAEEKDYNHQVDKDAEEFIDKFYKNLKQQKGMADLDSPSPCHLWAV